MFERYNERARRVIFFARFEASQYGSPFIESEHLLLGLLREDFGLMKGLFKENLLATKIRAEIDRAVEKKERIPTSVEVPLTQECKRILTAAAEEADRLGHRHVGTGHLVLGILRAEESFAARILRSKGAEIEELRSNAAHAETLSAPGTRPTSDVLLTVESFLEGLKSNSALELASFFSRNGEFIDAEGKRWSGKSEIEKAFVALFAPYAKRKACFILEEVRPGPYGIAVATLLWENIVPSEHSVSVLRMTLVLASEDGAWTILQGQATPILLR